MARAAPSGDLGAMTIHNACHVRETPPPYSAHEAGQPEYPAAGVLADLGQATDDAVPRIVARFAALQSRLLQDERAHPALVHHAAVAARSYLAALPPNAETRALAGLCDARTAPAAAWDAGRAAADEGHHEGAISLFRAGYLAARRRREIRWAATLAASLAVLLETLDLEGGALWARRSRRLQALSARR